METSRFMHRTSFDKGGSLAWLFRILKFPDSEHFFAAENTQKDLLFIFRQNLLFRSKSNAAILKELISALSVVITSIKKHVNKLR